MVGSKRLEEPFFATSRPRTDAGARLVRERMRAALFGRTPAPVRIGRYVIIERIGAGGFGEVYAAHDERLDRRVALKLVRTERRSAELLREAQVLARLAHPNVVALFDAFVTGGPSHEIAIAMELVAGRPLDAWLTASHRSPREIVRVLVEAGRGLAAAHRAGVIHRDFKPANVMVGDDGRVRVLDFGIASHATHDTPGGGTPPLGVRAPVMGTPAYMAPEAHLGDELDARADEFSFCTTLWEALFGRLPHGGTIVAVLGDTRARWPPTIPRRPALPSRIRRTLVRGLALDRDERFADMDALLHELAFERRRGSIAAVALLGGAAAIAWVSSSSDTRPCEDGERRLVGLWDDERRDEIEAGFIATGSSSADAAFGRTRAQLDAWRDEWLAAHRRACTEADDASLDRRMACLHRQLHALRAASDVLARVDRAGVVQAQRVLDGLPDVLACEHASTDAAPFERADVDELRGQIARAVALSDAGRYDDALELAEHARARALAIDAPGLRAEADYARGNALSSLVRPAEAVAAFEDGAATAMELGDDRLTTLCARGLVWDSSTLADFAGAERWAATGRASLSRMGGDPDLEARLHNAVGSLEFDRRRFDEAITEYSAGLAIVRATFGARNHRAAMYLGNIANVLHSRGDYAAAIAKYDEALPIALETLGPAHPTTLQIRSNLAGALAMIERWEAAESHARAVVETWERDFGDDHPELGFSLVALGSTIQPRDPALAGTHYRRAIAVLEPVLGTDSLQLIPALDRLAEVDVELGNTTSARAHLERARAILDHNLPAPNVDRMFVLSALARIARLEGRTDDALAIAQSCLREADAADASQHFLVGAVRSEAGAALLAADRVDEAIAWLEPAEPVLAAAMPDTTDLAILRARIAEARRRARERR